MARLSGTGWLGSARLGLEKSLCERATSMQAWLYFYFGNKGVLANNSCKNFMLQMSPVVYLRYPSLPDMKPLAISY